MRVLCELDGTSIWRSMSATRSTMRSSDETARHPRLGTARALGSIIALWTVLVVCCAWPPAQAIASSLSLWEHAGMAAGVVVWIGVTAWLYERRRRASDQ